MCDRLYQRIKLTSIKFQLSGFSFFFLKIVLKIGIRISIKNTKPADIKYDILSGSVLIKINFIKLYAFYKRSQIKKLP